MSDHASRIHARRNAGALRDLEWTGERMLPWTDDPVIAYEHLHRYAFATRLAHGRRVLDVGCGEGYGAALLASRAASVVGIDADARAIDHAAATYSASNLTFATAAAEDLSAYGDGAFDLVICFEVIEHVAEQERVVAEARRVLADDGWLVCSTPERDRYRERTGDQNPFHVRELARREFQDLLGSAFPNVTMWAQEPVTGSLLQPLGEPEKPGATVYVERDGDYWDVRERPDPLYLVAVASAGALPAAELSVLADPALLLFEQQRARADDLELRLQGYRAGMERREAEVRELAALGDDLRAEALAAGDLAAERDLQRAAAEQRLAEVESSPSWRALERCRTLLRHPDGTPNLAGRAASSLIAPVARRMPKRDQLGPR